MTNQVDVIALSRVEREVATKLVALQADLGDLPPDDEFWRKVVVAAHPLFEVGGVEEGFRVLAIVPPTYFRGPMLEQMALDPDLADKGRLMADALLEAGRAKLPRYFVDTTKHIPQRFMPRA